MSKKISLFLIAIFGALTLSSCLDLKKITGLEKDTPNEFLIEKKSPLALPPDHKMLPPDSKEKIQDVQKSNNSLKAVLDKNFSNKDSQDKLSNSTSENLEKEILKQIK